MSNAYSDILNYLMELTKKQKTEKNPHSLYDTNQFQRLDNLNSSLLGNVSIKQFFEDPKIKLLNPANDVPSTMEEANPFRNLLVNPFFNDKLIHSSIFNPLSFVSFIKTNPGEKEGIGKEILNLNEKIGNESCDSKNSKTSRTDLTTDEETLTNAISRNDSPLPSTVETDLNKRRESIKDRVSKDLLGKKRRTNRKKNCDNLLNKEEEFLSAKNKKEENNDNIIIASDGNNLIRSLSNANAENNIRVQKKNIEIYAEKEYEKDLNELQADLRHVFMKNHFPNMYSPQNLYINIKLMNEKRSSNKENMFIKLGDKEILNNFYLFKNHKTIQDCPSSLPRLIWQPPPDSDNKSN